MTAIAEEGFLSEEAKEIIGRIRTKYSDVFSLAEDLNRLSMNILTNLSVDSSDSPRLAVHALFLRTVENFQSLVLLVERGLISQAKVLVRSMLEAVFTLVALQKDPALLKAYFDQYENARRRALKSILGAKTPGLKKAVKEHGLEAAYIQQKAKLRSMELKLLTPFEWATRAGLEDLYNGYYVIYSSSTHSNLSALEDHLDKTSDQVNLSFGPSDKDFYDVVQCGIYSLLNALKSTTAANGDTLTEVLEDYAAHVHELDLKYLLDDA